MLGGLGSCLVLRDSREGHKKGPETLCTSASAVEGRRQGSLGQGARRDPTYYSDPLGRLDLKVT